MTKTPYMEPISGKSFSGTMEKDLPVSWMDKIHMVISKYQSGLPGSLNLEVINEKDKNHRNNRSGF